MKTSFVPDAQRQTDFGLFLHNCLTYKQFSIITVTRNHDSEDGYVLVMLFCIYFFSRPLIFRRCWANFRETLPHDVVSLTGVFICAP